jgi:hypothetical protein
LLCSYARSALWRGAKNKATIIGIIISILLNNYSTFCLTTIIYKDMKKEEINKIKERTIKYLSSYGALATKAVNSLPDELFTKRMLARELPIEKEDLFNKSIDEVIAYLKTLPRDYTLTEGWCSYEENYIALEYKELESDVELENRIYNEALKIISDLKDEERKAKLKRKQELLKEIEELGV